MIPILLLGTGLLVGLVAGYLLRDIRDKITAMYEMFKDRLETPAGVVRAERRPVTKHEPINLESETGGVMKLSPTEIVQQNLREREERARNL